MALVKRVSRLVQGYIEKQWRRLEELERELDRTGEARTRAEKELEEALQPDTPRPRPLPPPSTSSGATSPQPSTPTSETRKPPQVEWDENHCYRVLGLPEGTDFALVRRTYSELMSKSDPSRFPEGSEEHTKAQYIRTQIERAYATLLRKFDASSERFGEIELMEEENG